MIGVDTTVLIDVHKKYLNNPKQRAINLLCPAIQKHQQTNLPQQEKSNTQKP